MSDTLVSLRTKLIALVSFILLAGFFATSALNYQVSKGALRTTVLENELPLSSNNVYSEIQADLLRPIEISSQMAADTFVHDWVDAGEQDAGPMVRYLKSVRDSYDTFTAYFISAQTYKYYHFTGVSRVLDPTSEQDSWFLAARNAKDPYQVNIDDNEEQGRALTIFINYRVEDAGGNFLGIIGVGLGLDSVARLVDSYQQNFRRNIYFVDHNGLVRIHANSALVGKSNLREMQGLSAIADDLLNADRGSYTYDGTDGTVLLTTRYLPELSWYLLIELPESQAIEDIKKGFIRSLLIGPLVILMTIGLIIFTINKFQRRLEDMAISDKLTGLKNRQFSDMALNMAIKRFARNAEPFVVLMLDIDHFKPINDQRGHLTGDRVIARIAEVLQGAARESDIVSRWGGEEFMVLAANCSLIDAQRLSTAIHQAMAAESFFADDPDARITLSIGLTDMRDGDTEEALIARADKALYQAKDNGRNRTEVL